MKIAKIFCALPLAALLLAGCKEQPAPVATAPTTVDAPQPLQAMPTARPNARSNAAPTAKAAPTARTNATSTPTAPKFAATTKAGTAATSPVVPKKPFAPPKPLVIPPGKAPTGSPNEMLSARGQITEISPAPNGGAAMLMVKHEAIPGFMPAMEMRFPFAKAADAAQVKAGDKIAFRIKRNNLAVSDLEKLPPSTPLKLAK